MNFFDKTAKNWDKEERRHNRAKLVSKQIKELSKSNGHALDFGCGTGLLGFELINDFDKISFFDTSKGMLDIVKEKSKDFSNVEVLDKFIGKFDTIFNMMVMHHIDNHKEIIEKFYKNLNKNGELYIMDLELEDGSFHNKEDTAIHNGLNKDTLKELLVKTGFQEISFYESFEAQRNNRVYPSFLMRAIKK